MKVDLLNKRSCCLTTSTTTKKPLSWILTAVTQILTTLQFQVMDPRIMIVSVIRLSRGAHLASSCWSYLHAMILNQLPNEVIADTVTRLRGKLKEKHSWWKRLNDETPLVVALTALFVPLTFHALYWLKLVKNEPSYSCWKQRLLSSVEFSSAEKLTRPLVLKRTGALSGREVISMASHTVLDRHLGVIENILVLSFERITSVCWLLVKQERTRLDDIY